MKRKCKLLKLLVNYTLSIHKVTKKGKKNVDVKDSQCIYIFHTFLQDTSRLERYSPLPPNVYRGLHGAVLVYDVTSRSSFDRLDFCLNELNTHSTDTNTVKMLVGNKIDEVSERERKMHLISGLV